MSDSQHETAGVIAPPPLLFVGGLALGQLVHKAVPRGFVPQRWRVPLGVALVGGGGALAGWAFTTMRRAHTSPEPWRPTTAIVMHGPFRYTRNPIYVAFTLIYVGLAAWRNSLATLLLLPAVLTVLRRGVIEREEAYLERRFGDEYMQYKARARRWV